MHEEIELDRLYISPLRSPQQPLLWPTADELARAREFGLIEPVIVRPLPGTRPPDYEILFGLKRWLLAQRLSLATVPIIVRAVSDETARRWVTADNHDGSMENPLAIARALQRRVAQGLTVAAAGRELGLSRTDASHRLRMLRLTPEILARVAAGELAPGTARALVGLPPEQQRALAKRILHERLSARQVEALAKVWKTAGGDPAPAAKTASSTGDDPDQARLERALAEHLGTPAAVRYTAAGGGQLVIDFDNLDILEGVLERLGLRW